MAETIRRAQVITTYGVGAMIATRDESLMLAGLEFWPVGAPDLHEPRLERRLGVFGFVQPPSGDSAPALPVVRFPMYYHCPNCGWLARFWEIASSDTASCRDCEVPLVPSRFVVACEAGHIDDFPYMQWVHEGAAFTKSCRLTLSTTGVSAALRDVVVSCTCGVPARSLDGAFNAREIAKVASCQGRRPWLKDSEPCSKSLRTLQRGASNVWFGDIVSALSIPPWSDAAFNAINRVWAWLRSVSDPHQLRQMLEGMGGEAILGASVDEIVHAAIARRQEEEGMLAGDEVEFRRQEFNAIRVGRAETGRQDEFIARPGTVPAGLRPWLSELVTVDRLREVRVLKSFSRLFPPVDDPEDESRVAPISKMPQTWLPAIEVRGEGLFLALDDAQLQDWEAQAEVKKRARDIIENHVAHELRGDHSKSFVTPRLILIHTLAHALVDALSLDAGYPAASLRERLYVSDDMCALLIYTATSDSAGSLGGVVSQGAPEVFERIFLDAIARHAWCSADPVCIEAESQGVGGMNKAACHACALLPETSCEHRNTLLDRGLLVGTPSSKALGYFNGLAGVNG